MRSIHYLLLEVDFQKQYDICLCIYWFAPHRPPEQSNKSRVKLFRFLRCEMSRCIWIRKKLPLFAENIYCATDAGWSMILKVIFYI